MKKQKNLVSIYSIIDESSSGVDAEMDKQIIRIWEILAEIGGFDKNKKVYIKPGKLKPLSDKELMEELMKPMPPIG